jgi:hypothetical protein
MKKSLAIHFAALMIAGFALTNSAAYASFSYGLTLTATSGPALNGTGILTLETAIPLTGSFSATEGGTVSSTTTDLLSLSFTIDGDTFSTTHENGASSADFFNDVLENLAYNLDSVNPELEIGGTSYTFSPNGSTFTNGNVTFNPAVLTPEPASMLLVGGALVLFAFYFSRLTKPTNSRG